MIKKILALVAIAIAAPAIADTNVLFATYGNQQPGPQPISTTLAAHADENHNLYMSALASDPGGVNSIRIYGNGTVLATCFKPVCVYVWDRNAMKPGPNANLVIFQYFDSKNALRQSLGYFTQPPLQ